MNIQTDAVVINQCDRCTTQEFKFNNSNIKWVDTTDRGLSLSRNMALRNANGKMCLLSDDDLEYLSGYEEIILSQFKKYPDADIIAFQVEGIERKFKDYYPNPRKINYLTSMSISSVEIAFRLDSIKKRNIIFNKLFGAGAKYIMGEESIFLTNCLKNGLKIMYVPQKIAYLHLGESTWFKGFNKEYLISKGAQFTAMSKIFSALLIIQFVIRKYKLYGSEITRFEAVKFMFEGRKKYLGKIT
jgi:glycosyltransferase involved in cell wall biosynthesis